MILKPPILGKFNKTPLQQIIFKAGIKELQANFNLKEFSTDRAKLYYRKFKEEGFTNWMFTRIKEHILEREKYFPVIATFYDYLEDIYVERQEIQNMERIHERDNREARKVSAK